jgi:hypothetical protein
MLTTLFVIPGDGKPNIEQAVRSFGKLLLKNIVVCEDRNPPFHEAQAPYFSYMYSDEWCNDSLRLALPIFFQHWNWDCLVLFRRNIGENKYFQAPRIFKSGMEMDGLLPKYPSCLLYERLLNGYLLRA